MFPLVRYSPTSPYITLYTSKYIQYTTNKQSITPTGVTTFTLNFDIHQQKAGLAARLCPLLLGQQNDLGVVSVPDWKQASIPKSSSSYLEGRCEPYIRYWDFWYRYQSTVKEVPLIEVPVPVHVSIVNSQDGDLRRGGGLRRRMSPRLPISSSPRKT